jgi:hypothetical protein
MERFCCCVENAEQVDLVCFVVMLNIVIDITLLSYLCPLKIDVVFKIIIGSKSNSDLS